MVYFTVTQMKKIVPVFVLCATTPSAQDAATVIVILPSPKKEPV